MLMKRKLLLFALLPALTAMLTCTSCGDDGTDGSGKAVFTLGSPDDGNDPSAVRISSGNYSKIFTIETPAPQEQFSNFLELIPDRLLLV